VPAHGDPAQAIESAPALRVAMLTGFVAPYRRPLFERLAATPGWQLRVLISAHSERDRSWSLVSTAADVRRVRSLALGWRTVSSLPVRFAQRTTVYLPIGLWSALHRFRPTVVLSGELGPRTGIAAAYCGLRRIPLVIRSYHSRVSATQTAWRLPWRRFLLRRARLVLGMGKQAREVLTAWGVPADRIVDGLNSAASEALVARLAEPVTPQRVAKIRQGLAGRRMALVAGRLVPLKGTAQLLAAWRRLPEGVRQAWRLVFVGDGPLRGLVEQAADVGVIHAGFIPREEIADWYRAADLTVFASLGDVWGLVVNESLACGTPVLCSRHAAACDDLIEHGATGLVFDPADPEAALRGLEAALTHPDLERLGAAGPASEARCGLDQLVDAYRSVVEQAAAAAPIT
jgi:glycosyltransferase involved in cell wall biosynthesis